MVLTRCQIQKAFQNVDPRPFAVCADVVAWVMSGYHYRYSLSLSMHNSITSSSSSRSSSNGSNGNCSGEELCQF